MRQPTAPRSWSSFFSQQFLFSHYVGEATGAVYRMQSKWMDAAIHIATYHLQLPQYDKIKPPSYSKYHHLNEKFLTRDRERVRASHFDIGTAGKISSERALLRSIERISTTKAHNGKSNWKKMTAESQTRISTDNLGVEEEGAITVIRTLSKKLPNRISTRRFEQAPVSGEVRNGDSIASNANNINDVREEEPADDNDDELPRKKRRAPQFLCGRPRKDGNWEPLFDDGRSTYIDPQNPSNIERCGFASIQGEHTPILFLQELAHLSSLMNAVALSTLRNDVEGVASPLSLYQPGSPWPEVDPQLDQNLYDSRLERYWFAWLYFLGQGRSPAERTRYNAARPMSVLGGVSDAEIQMLQVARGPLAKTQLCFFWLSEFAVREYDEGAHGALISRCMQFLSDGMTGYNDARKIMFNPFPL